MDKVSFKLFFLFIFSFSAVSHSHNEVSLGTTLPRMLSTIAYFVVELLSTLENLSMQPLVNALTATSVFQMKIN